MENLYEILGVDKSSSQEEIKKAYRKLAIQHHPDKNNGSKESEDKFKKIQEAYDILSNEEKRQNYDRFGDANKKEFDINDIFSSMFGGFNNFTNFGDSFINKRGSDVKISMDISISDIINGVNKTVKYKRSGKCNTCNGFGGTDKTTCRPCGGTGVKVNVQHTPFGKIQQSGPCQDCNGTGSIIKNKCNICNGNGTCEVEELTSIKIPPGALNGMQLNIKGAGNYYRNGQFGDLIVFINEIPDSKFKRAGINIQCEEWITISEAVLGTSIKIDSPTGKINVKVPNGTDSGSVFTIKGKGIPNISNYGSGGSGDLLVKVNVKIPKILTPEQKEIFEKIKEIL